MTGIRTLVQQAWESRQAFVPEIYFSAPGAKHYENAYYSNHRNTFVNLSVTGANCACRCDHCDGRLLQTMIGTPSPAEMRLVIDNLLIKGCRGILVSGGATSHGEVPLLPFVEVMAYAKLKGLKVLVHSGLIKQETAAALKNAGVDQVLMDVIGDQNTINQVYHLKQEPDNYLRSMIICREAGLNIAPHVIIGLHYGQICGELKALQMIQQANPETIVLAVITPACGTAMADVCPPPIEEVVAVIATARILNPNTPLTLGCARPPGDYKRQLEIRAVDCGVNGIAYPDEATVVYANNKGLKTVFSDACCSLIGQNNKQGDNAR